MIRKPVFRSVITPEGFNMKYPRVMRLGKSLTASFNAPSQAIFLKQGKMVLGHEAVLMGKGTIKDLEMHVHEDKRKCGYGGLLHAISVILMKENNLKNIRLDSLPSAVKFHFNKGFRVCCLDVNDARTCVKSILNSRTNFVDIKNRAQTLDYDFSLGSKSAVERTSKLYNEYILRVIEEDVSYEDAMFPKTLSMELTEKALKKNKDLYNNIFRENKINYSI